MQPSLYKRCLEAALGSSIIGAVAGIVWVLCGFLELSLIAGALYCGIGGLLTAILLFAPAFVLSAPPRVLALLYPMSAVFFIVARKILIEAEIVSSPVAGVLLGATFALITVGIKFSEMRIPVHEDLIHEQIS